MDAIVDLAFMDSISSSVNNVITIITGGGIISLLALFFDNLSKRRAEYNDLTNKRIERFSEAQPLYMQIAGYYLNLAKTIKKLEDEPNKGINDILTIFYIYNIINLLEKYRKDFGGLIQLDNLEAEVLIHDLMWHIQNKLTQGKKNISMKSLHELQDISKSEITFESFLNDIKKNPQIFKEVLEWLRELIEKKELKSVRQKSLWYAILIHMEMIIMYKVYYGEENLKRFYHNLSFLKEDSELLLYLQNNYPDYYKRLHKIGFIKYRIS